MGARADGRGLARASCAGPQGDLRAIRGRGGDPFAEYQVPEAVLALRARAFDLILMDKNMPGPSGLDLLPGFRRVCPDSQVILMTAFGDVPSYMEAVEKGAAEYLFKPFRMEELRAAIAKALHIDAQSRP